MERHDDSVSFHFVDVFAERPLEGNPATVVADAARLTDAQMIAIAREFNQSETTFVLPPTKPGADVRMRAFTQGGKEAAGGAGHHTLGTCWWLAESGALKLGDAGGRFTLEDGPSLLPIHVTCESGRVTSVAMEQSRPVLGKVCADLDELAASLGLALSDLATDALPAQVVSTGVGHLHVPIRDRAALNKARPDMARLGALLRTVEGEGCYIFTRDTVRSDSAAHARFFNPTLGILEDAATGTAAGPLACHLVAHGLANGAAPVRIEQGDSMGRLCILQVRVSETGVLLSGRCVVSGSGRLRVA
jgi:trans-2,3-dihydro-3-hydroxyanthranilate isomerase